MCIRDTYANNLTRSELAGACACVGCASAQRERGEKGGKRNELLCRLRIIISFYMWYGTLVDFTGAITFMRRKSLLDLDGISRVATRRTFSLTMLTVNRR